LKILQESQPNQPFAREPVDSFAGLMAVAQLVAIVLISARELDSHLTGSNDTGNIAQA
jgi:hypothetical protein